MPGNALLMVRVNLPVDDVSRIGTVSLRRGIHRTAALIRLIRIGFYIDDVLRDGGRVKVVDKHGNEQDIVFN